jgi:hypothetical protein
MQSRRKFIATGIAGASLVLAGCSGGEASGGDTEAEWQAGTEETGRRILEDEWLPQPISLDRDQEIRIGVTVREGPAIDIVTCTESEYRAFANGDRFQYDTDLSMPDSTGGQVSGKIDAGEYVLVLDNTNRIEAEPPTNFDDDIVTVDYTIEFR